MDGTTPGRFMLSAPRALNRPLLQSFTHPAVRVCGATSQEQAHVRADLRDHQVGAGNAPLHDARGAKNARDEWNLLGIV